MDVFFSSRVGADAAALNAAFVQCAQLAAATGQRNITVLVPQKGNVQGTMSELLGEQATVRLLRDNRLDLGAHMLYLATRRIAVSHNGPVLAAWCTPDLVENVVEGYYATHLVIVAWTPEELVAFRSAYPHARAFD